MKKTITVLVALTILVCCNEKEAENKLPNCKILSPENDGLIKRGNELHIKVEASDSDGSIQEVYYSIGEDIIGSNTSIPYELFYNTSRLELGSHTIKATAIDEQEGEVSDMLTFEVVSDISPIPDFEASDTIIITGQNISFIDLSLNEPSSWLWNFGDGNTSEDQNPIHTYTKAGQFTVLLTVKNSAGQKWIEKDHLITVNVQDVDGNIYPAVKIGNQIWMAQNLSTSNYNDGSEINLVEDSLEWINLTSSALCWYNNDKEEAFSKGHGALYNWYAVETNKLCPKGWHVPTLEEHLILQQHIAGERLNLGEKLKDKDAWGELNVGYDNYGFKALPAGLRTDSAKFVGSGTGAQWWLNSTDTTGNPWTWYLHNTSNNISRGAYDIKNFGASVRCVQD